MRLFDVTAKEDSQPQCSDIQDFVTLAQLKTEGLEMPACATLEKDFFRLDGSMEPFPDEPMGRNWGLWSHQMSGEDGRFAMPLTLKLGFTQSHSSIGLTLRFDEREQDWCRRLRVAWQDRLGNILAMRDFYPTEPKVFLKNKVEGFCGLEITFLETNKPCRYLKLAGIDYGLGLPLGGSDIQSAELLEEVSLASDQISVNTLDFTLHSATGEFSPLNPDGVFSALQQKQELAVYAILDGTRKFMGSYYLERWESGARGELRLHGVDAMGVMDKVRFMGGMYEGAEADTVLKEIFGLCRLEYCIDPVLASKELWGHIAAATARDALWQIAFAIGGVVDTSRSTCVRLYPVPTRPSVMIGHDRKFAGQKMKQKPTVTGIDMTTHRYGKGGEAAVVFEDTLPRGETTVLFDQPVCDLTVAGAELLTSGANYATLRVSRPGTVVLSGKKYTDAKQEVCRTMPRAPNLTDNRLRVDGATLVSQKNVGEVLDRLTGHYARQYQSEFAVRLGSERVADMVAVRNKNGETLKGLVESISVNLTGGCIAKMTICAACMEMRSQCYTTELWAGQWMGVM